MVIMSRKAEISTETIVVAALAMIVLVVLIIIFKTQISNLAGGFMNTGNSAKAGLNGNQCQTLIGGRVCGGTTAYTQYEAKYQLTPVTPPVGASWSDCGSQACYDIGPAK